MGTPEVASGSRLVFVAGRERRVRAVRSVGYGLAGLFAAYVAALALSLVGAVHLQVPGLPPLPSPRPAPEFHVAVRPGPAPRRVGGAPVVTAGGVTGGSSAPTYAGGQMSSPPVSPLTATAIPGPTTVTTAATAVATTTATTAPAAPYGAQPATTSTAPTSTGTASATTQANGRSSTHPTPTSTAAPRSSTTLASHR